jgi:2-oxoglutarate ferredoxin oxidoreductase subunit delta
VLGCISHQAQLLSSYHAALSDSAAPRHTLVLCYNCSGRKAPNGVPEPERQPFAGSDMTQGRIVIDSKCCKGCELCIGVCPQHVIRMSDSFNARGYHPAQLVDAAGACTGCGVCAIVCPDVAITVYRQLAKELRTKNREPATLLAGSRFSVLGSGEGRLP